MRFLVVLSAIFIGLARPAYALVLDEMIQTFNEPKDEQIVSPKTTEELRALFSEANIKQLPRIFVDKLPSDFAQKGDKILFSQVIGALILRENEKALQDKIIVNLLKKKLDTNEEWTDAENAFFAFLVDKYDVIAKKTIPTQLEQLLQKADEVPIAMAVAQSVYDTDWGKKNMDAPYGQEGWLDEEHYDRIKFDSLLKATESYVREMNSTPNYFMWRTQRQQAAHRGSARNHGFDFALALRVYRPQDPIYQFEIRKLILSNPFLGQMENAVFIDQDKQ